MSYGYSDLSITFLDHRTPSLKVATKFVSKAATECCPKRHTTNEFSRIEMSAYFRWGETCCMGKHALVHNPNAEYQICTDGGSGPEPISLHHRRALSIGGVASGHALRPHQLSGTLGQTDISVRCSLPAVVGPSRPWRGSAVSARSGTSRDKTANYKLSRSSPGFAPPVPQTESFGDIAHQGTTIFKASLAAAAAETSAHACKHTGRVKCWRLSRSSALIFDTEISARHLEAFRPLPPVGACVQRSSDGVSDK